MSSKENKLNQSNYSARGVGAHAHTALPYAHTRDTRRERLETAERGKKRERTEDYKITDVVIKFI